MRSNLARAGAIAGVTVALLALGAAAQAGQTVRTGSVSVTHVKVHQTEATVFTTGMFTDLPGAEVVITIGTGEMRMLDARFAAESTCSGIAGGVCSVRIVLLGASWSIELDPASGLDFAFDSVGADRAEAHAMERSSAFLAEGTYRVRVQAAVSQSGAIQFRLDDWTLVVEAVQPPPR